MPSQINKLLAKSLGHVQSQFITVPQVFAGTVLTFPHKLINTKIYNLGKHKNCLFVGEGGLTAAFNVPMQYLNVCLKKSRTF